MGNLHLAVKKIDSRFSQIYYFSVSALIFLFSHNYIKGTLRQIVIANYVASALIEFDPERQFPVVSGSRIKISLETGSAVPPQPVSAYFR
jgi:hypothetical protein